MSIELPPLELEPNESEDEGGGSPLLLPQRGGGSGSDEGLEGERAPA